MDMQEALEADGEKLRQLTGQDHGPFFIPEPLAAWPDVAQVLSAHEVHATGSRAICSTFLQESDHDFLVFAVDGHPLTTDLILLGFEQEGGALYPGQDNAFASWRRDNLNLIVTRDADFSKKHIIATALCKRLNLLHKPDRIAVFQAVLYGKAV